MASGSQVYRSRKLVKIGVWEDGQFVGCVLFGRGANNHIGEPFGMKQTEVCELVRVALARDHIAPVTKVISIALKILKKNSPGLRLVVSFADPEQGHHGGIYQAGNWIYLGSSHAQREVMFDGKVMHKRTAHSKFGTIKGLRPSRVLWKHKYVMPLDRRARMATKPRAKPYPTAGGADDT